MRKVTLLLCASLLLLHLSAATNGNWAGIFSNWPTGPERQSQVKSTSIPANTSAILCNKEVGEEKTMVLGCDLTTYQSATILGAGDFPYTSGTGVTVNVTTNVGTLANQDYSCNGNTFSTAPIAWWINTTEHFITLNFSAPVTNFSMVMNGCNNTEVFTFTPTTGTVSLNNFCTAAFEVIGAGNQLRCNASGTNGTLVTINNPTGSTQYTITHNGLLAGSRISLLDCYVGGPVPVVNPISNVQACGGDMVSAIAFTGTSGATFNWTNNNTAIGLASSGTGNIASFTAANVTSQQVATITVTPVLSPQTGTPITFTITVKPKPTLTIGTIMSPVTCGGSNGSIAFTTTNLPNGIYSLTYTGPGSPQNVIVSGNAFLLSGRSAGAYSNFSISLNGCAGTAAGPVTLADPSYTWYRDMDGDTFGNPAMTQMACSQPTGYVANNTDCDDTDPLEKPGQVWYDDTDNDGHGQTGAASITACLRPTGYKAAVELMSTAGDCNDNNAAIKPGATEICDSIDNDCDGMTDEGVQTTYYRDMDGDSFGNPSNTTMACSLPTGYVTNNTDCDDTDPLEKPGQVWYDDTDNDGHGQTGAASITACLRPTGYKAAVELMSTAGDCNDNNAAIKPGATEICDSIDNDCDGMTDEGVQTTYYRDMDGDSFGNPSNTTMACSLPTGYVTNNTDCDDTDPLEKPGQVWYDDTDNDGHGQTGAASITACLRPTGYKAAAELMSTAGDCNDNNFNIKPGATEICDGIDNDCDGEEDNGLVFVTYYQDFDGDNYGNPAVSQTTCNGVPTGYVANNTDCNDNNPALNPNTVWYLDADNDDYYTGAGITQCTSPGAGYRRTGILGGNDCNDNDDEINPGATEICDGIDNDCDGEEDNELVFVTYYQDLDGDNYGNPAVSQTTCNGAPTGYVANNTDCNDNNPALNPNTVWYLDADNDDYYTGAGITQCTSPGAGYRRTGILGGNDCNDNDDEINPGATEICDGIDNDCDGEEDNELVFVTYYQDFDGDNYGNPAVSQTTCNGTPTGYVANNTDCNDNNPALNPNTVWYLDADNDDYYTGAGITQCTSPGAGYRRTGILGGNDCNDNDDEINPGATEICDGIDNDCDGEEDNGLVFVTYYQDLDGDNYGNPEVSQTTCNGAPTGYVANNTDCNDNNPALNPNTVWYLDADNDGYYTGAGITQCTSPGAGYRSTGILGGNDCNDNDDEINPGATEICDGIDNDCDGEEDNELVFVTYYQDLDGDNYGNPAVSQTTCNGAPTGYVANNTDCNDNNPALNPNTVWYLDADNDGYYTGAGITQCTSPGAGYRRTGILGGNDCNDNDDEINPGATEICDGIDNDCDGEEDNGLVFVTYYQDFDGDNYGNPAVSQTTCNGAPTGYVANNTDCNDNNPALNPNTVWYLDADNDGYYTGAGITQCTSPGAGYRRTGILGGNDCNDNDDEINPGATEICDGIDNDCDGEEDNGLVFVTYYQDFDGDNYGNPAVSQTTCNGVPTGYVANNTDCDDNNPALNPNTVWYLDADNDGYYTGAGITQCTSPGAGYRSTGILGGNDCNDNDDEINPGATEICDGIDNDCDGEEDNGLVFVTYYQDFDGDNYGNPAVSQTTCNGAPTGYVANNTDCNDNNPALNPNTVWYLDADNDGYYTGAGITQCTSPGAGYRRTGILGGNDCNDNDDEINPGATEICDGIDNDCDGEEDNGLVFVTYYQDFDGDNYGNPAVSQTTCNGAPTGYVANNTDCNDNNPALNPNTVWYLDADNDGYYTGAGITQCTSPGAGYRRMGILGGNDCNDNDDEINPALRKFAMALTTIATVPLTRAC